MKRSTGLILAGMQSSSGKTAVTCLLLSALRRRGIALQPFKVGPDYIDPGYHQRFAGISSINLDSWLMGPTSIPKVVQTFGAGRVSVVEGVMGLFDGASPTSNEGSTVELARWLEWPIVLVVNAEKAGRSLGAAIRGFIEQAKPAQIAGLILNRVGSEGHATYLKAALSDLNVPIVGVLTKHETLAWPERHLGLQAQSEMQLPSWEAMAELGETTLEMDTILSWLEPAPFTAPAVSPSARPTKTIAIAQDEAFHFYYQANLTFLESQGAKLVPFSPLNDSSIPAEADGLIFGGGFPEVFLSQLADNASMGQSIAQAIRAGMPCYAECGGLMLLAEQIITIDGHAYPMAGIVPGAIQMTLTLQNFGYSRCIHPQYPETPPFHGHEFHYSRWIEESKAANLWDVSKKFRGSQRKEGYRSHNLHASYVHLYFPTSASLITGLFGLKPTES